MSELLNAWPIVAFAVAVRLLAYLAKYFVRRWPF